MSEMPSEKQQRAEHCFQDLLALDEHSAARQELEAAKVPAHSITALYGDELEALIPALLLRLEARKPDLNLADLPWLKAELRMRFIRISLLGSQLDAALNRQADFMVSSAGQELRIYVRALPYEKDDLAKLVQTLWWTHWAMRNRPSIPLQGNVDELMIWTYEHILAL